MRTPKQIALEVVPADSKLPKTFTLTAMRAARAAMREVLQELREKADTEFCHVCEVKEWAEQRDRELGPAERPAARAQAEGEAC